MSNGGYIPSNMRSALLSEITKLGQAPGEAELRTDVQPPSQPDRSNEGNWWQRYVSGPVGNWFNQKMENAKTMQGDVIKRTTSSIFEGAGAGLSKVQQNHPELVSAFARRFDRYAPQIAERFGAGATNAMMQNPQVKDTLSNINQLTQKANTVAGQANDLLGSAQKGRDFLYQNKWPIAGGAAALAAAPLLGGMLMGNFMSRGPANINIRTPGQSQGQPQMPMPQSNAPRALEKYESQY